MAQKEQPTANRNYKDTVFRMLSGNLGQVVLCDRGSNVRFFDIGDLFV